MALIDFYIGEVGPLRYDDSKVYPGTAIPMQAFYSALGGVRIDTAPAGASFVLRLEDLAGGSEHGDRRYSLLVG